MYPYSVVDDHEDDQKHIFRVVETVHQTPFCRHRFHSDVPNFFVISNQSSLPGVSGGHAEPRGSQWLGQLLGDREDPGSHFLGDRSWKPVLNCFSSIAAFWVFLRSGIYMD